MQAEAYLADLDGTRSPLTPPWIDLGDWGQERVAPQKEARVDEKKKLVQLRRRAAKSVVFAADPTNHGSIDQPLSGLRIRLFGFNAPLSFVPIRVCAGESI